MADEKPTTAIRLANGEWFDFANPDPRQLSIDVIANSLSKVCRFGGHCNRFYSVAEHMVLCFAVARRKIILGEETYCGTTVRSHAEALHALLLHDAVEAICQDIVRPLKTMLRAYQNLEERLQHVVAARFNVDFVTHAEFIKKYDNLLLKNEQRILFEGPDSIVDYEVDSSGVMLRGLAPTAAKLWLRETFEDSQDAVLTYRRGTVTKGTT